jgi:hypothetical protein
VPAQTPTPKAPATALTAQSGVGTIRERRVRSGSSVRGRTVPQWNGIGWRQYARMLCDRDDSRRGAQSESRCRRSILTALYAFLFPFPKTIHTSLPLCWPVCRPYHHDFASCPQTNSFCSLSTYLCKQVSAQCSALVHTRPMNLIFADPANNLTN